MIRPQSIRFFTRLSYEMYSAFPYIRRATRCEKVLGSIDVSCDLHKLIIIPAFHLVILKTNANWLLYSK